MPSPPTLLAGGNAEEPLAMAVDDRVDVEGLNSLISEARASIMEERKARGPYILPVLNQR